MAQVFFCEFCEISKTPFFIEHLWTTASVDAKNEYKAFAEFVNIRIYLPMHIPNQVYLGLN